LLTLLRPGETLTLNRPAQKNMSDEDKTIENGSQEGLPPQEENNDEGTDDGLDSLLDELGKAAEADDAKSDEGDDSGEDKPFYKKVGKLEFHTFEEYDKWAMKNHGDLSNVAGELSRLKKAPGAVEKKPQAEQKTEVDIEKIAWRLEVRKFNKEYPDATKHRDSMAVFLRNGQAKDASGNPSLMKAYEMSKRAVGEEIPQVKKTPDQNLKNQKRIMKAGSGDSGSGDNYKDAADIDASDDFANKALTGQIH